MLQERRASNHAALVGRRVRVTQNLDPQMPGELKLRIGDLATVNECPVDGSWCRITTSDARQGLCPIGFVELATEAQATTAFDQQPLYDCVPGDIDNNDLHENMASMITSKLPTYDIVPGDSENTTLQATVIADFKAEFANEMTCKQGDQVLVLNNNDDDWSLCSTINGSISGLVPTSYLDFANCTEVQNYTPQENLDDANIIDKRCVLFDYYTGVDGDLTARAGETLNIIKYNDADWCTARNELGQTGLIAINYLTSRVSPRMQNDDVTWRNKPSPTVYNQDVFLNYELDSLTPLPSEINDKRFSSMIESQNQNSTRGSYASTSTLDSDNWFGAFNDARKESKACPPPRPTTQPKFDPETHVEEPMWESSSTSIKSQDTEAKKCALHREMLETETSFVNECTAVVYTLLEFRQNPGIDVDALSDGLKQVVELSTLIKEGLERQIADGTYQAGSVFCQYEAEIRSTYNHYWKCNDRALHLLDLYIQDSKLKIDITEVLSKIRRRCPAIIDLHSALCKPVQRMLRYPIYLQKLLKYANSDSEEEAMLFVAIHVVEELAITINESKRRKELVLKYRRMDEARLGTKLAKLNMHSIKKKSSRFSARLSSTLGLSHSDNDSEFVTIEIHYKHMQKCVEALTVKMKAAAMAERNLAQSRFSMVEKYREAWINNCNDSRENVDPAQKRVQNTALVNIQHRICQKILNEEVSKFTTSLETNCIKALEALAFKFKGPDNVITKRRDKYLDLSSKTSKKSTDDSSLEQCRASKQDYDALNTQLIEELPKFTNECYSIIANVLYAYNGLYADFQTNVESALKTELEKAFQNASTEDLGADPIQTLSAKFNYAYNRLINVPTLKGKVHIYKSNASNSSVEKERSKMTIFGASAHRKSGIRGNKIRRQNEQDKEILFRRYRRDQLYNVKRDALICEDVEIPVRQGELIGALIKKDPSGRGDRWYCDNGREKGLVNVGNLEPLDASNAAEATPTTASETSSLSGMPSANVTNFMTADMNSNLRQNDNTSFNRDKTNALISFDSPSNEDLALLATSQPAVVRPVQPYIKPVKAEDFGFSDLTEVKPVISSSVPVRNLGPTIPAAQRTAPMPQNQQPLIGIFQNQKAIMAPLQPLKPQKILQPTIQLQPNEASATYNNMKSNAPNYDVGDLFATEVPKPMPPPIWSNTGSARSDIDVIQPSAPKTVSSSLSPIMNRKNGAELETCMAKFDYQATNANQLSVKKDDIIFVVDKTVSSSSEWWLCENFDGQSGYLPANCLLQL